MKRSAQELVRLCLRKDPGAWEEFLGRFSRLVSWAIERSFNRCRFPFQKEDLEDVFQQVFLHLWEGALSGVQGNDRLEGWLAIVSYRVTIDYVRREKRKGQETFSLEGRLGEEKKDAAFEGLLPTKGEDPRHHLEEKVFQKTLSDIFETLTEKESCVLRLNLLEEKTHSEISELLKLPIGTVSSIIQRTKEKVRSALKKRLEGE